LLSTAACSVLALGSAASAQTATENEDDVDTLEEIVVTGSYIARANQENLSSPTVVMGAQEIAKTGMTGVDDLLTFNTANTGSIGGAQDLAGGGADDRDTRSANLRGLGVQSTLVLMNGRRVANTDGYTNLVALTPTIAVKRVETVLDGASATYGSDAIAGVMNIITDNRFEGLRLSGQYTSISDAPRYVVEGMVGAGNEDFHAVLSASYEYQDKLQGYEREVTNFDNTSGLAQPGNYILSARPVAAGGGDVIIDNGINGPINYSELYDQISARTGSATVQFADPWCTDPDTGGIYAGSNPFPDGACRFSYQQRNPVKPRSRVTLVHLDTEYNLSPEHTLYFEGRYYQQGTERFGIASFPITTGSLIVPEENPYNPFGRDVTFAGRLLGNQSPDRVEKVDLDSIHIVTGLKGEMPGMSGWSYNVTGVYSREDYTLYTSDTDMIAAQNALNGFGGADCQVSPNGVPAASEVAGEGNCVFFSPFGQDQQTNDPRTEYNILTPYQRSEKAELRYVEAVLTGDIFTLPGGAAGIAVGAQIRDESQAIALDSSLINGRFGFQGKSLPGEGQRTIKSIFSELYLPIASTIDIQLAARYEDYGLFDTFDPKIGINWRPLDWLAIRGSYSTAFRAPDVEETVSNQVTSNVGQTVDPLDPTDTGTFRVIRTVSNPDLAPEQSRNFNLGVSVRPIDDLTLSVDYFDFKFTDQIAQEAAQQVINSDPNGPRVERDEFGRLLAVNIGYFNAGKTRTNGFGFRATYNMDVGPGLLTIENMASLITTYEVQLGPDAPVIDALGGRNSSNPGAPAPKFRDNLRVSYSTDQHSGNVAMRYISSVTDDIGGGTVGSWTVFDAQYAFRFGGDTGATISVGAVNVFNRKPPAAAFTGYLPALHDALGRQAYIRLTFDL
jgi:iron complex outermembrane receptor protein